MRVTGRRMGMPALLTRTSRRPKVSHASSARAAAPAGSERSATHDRESGAWGLHASNTSASRSDLRATIPTVTPRAASARAVPAPIPDDAPVTSAMRDSSFMNHTVVNLKKSRVPNPEIS
jgi:hypothetical protein